MSWRLHLHHAANTGDTFSASLGWHTDECPLASSSLSQHFGKMAGEDRTSMGIGQFWMYWMPYKNAMLSVILNFITHHMVMPVMWQLTKSFGCMIFGHLNNWMKTRKHYMHTQTHTHTHSHTHTYIYIYTCKYIHIYTCIQNKEHMLMLCRSYVSAWVYAN
jgi:hypothetical protein